jgi:curved DNA-binding protein CbpA
MNVYDAAAILGVNANSTDAQVKRSWRSKAMMYHPDRNPSPNAEDQFKRIATAFQILVDGGMQILRLGESLHSPYSNNNQNETFMISGPYVQQRKRRHVNKWYWEEQDWLEQEFGHMGYWSRNGTKK